MDKVNVGMLGLGTVGSAVAEALLDRPGFFARQIGVPLRLKKVAVRNLGKKRRLRIAGSLLTDNPRRVLDDPEIDVVVELIGGVHPAKEYVLRALRNGKSVVTANKALLAHEGPSVFRAAARSGADLYFETAVAGGIPIVKTLREALAGNRARALYGILNGTTNFILSEMSRQDGCSFEEALAEAKRRGYAEADPSLDLKGVDTAHKLAILAFLAFGKRVSPKALWVEGIDGITAGDAAYARRFGFHVKLLGVAKEIDGGLEVRVHPTLLPAGHPLSSVGGVQNAVAVQGDLAGELILTGEGAGGKPSASAVLADLVDVARNRKSGTAQRVPPPLPTRRIRRIRKMGEIEGRYYFRFSVIDRPGVLARIAQILGRHRISITSVVQAERRRDRIVPVVMMTHEARERDVQKAIQVIDKLPVVKRKSVLLRIERG